MFSNPITSTSKLILVLVVIVGVATGLGAPRASAQTQNAKQQGQQTTKQQAQPQTAASSPCGAAATPTAGANQSAANASAAVKSAASAVSNLGSIFGKKKAAQPATQGANQPANQSTDASGACDPTVNAAAGAAAGVASTVDSVASLGAPATAGTGATPAAGAPATPAVARTAPTPAAKGSANSAAPPAASAAATPAAAAAASAPALAPSAPPNFSKLPDVNGIQLGMTVDQALAKIKALYPNPAGMTVSYVKFEKTADKPWVHDIVLQTSVNAGEHLTVRFNDPPDEQRVLFVSRSLIFQQGKQTTLANMKAALLQKYGQPRSSRSETLIWSFDEQGNPLNDPKLNGTDCSGAAVYNSAGEGGDPGRPTIAQLGVDPAQDDLQKNPCYSGVHISANTGIPMPDGLVISLDVNMSENGYATRTYIDEQAYIKNAANQAQQEQFKKAQERSAPKL
jgi:hypothetical protein